MKVSACTNDKGLYAKITRLQSKELKTGPAGKKDCHNQTDSKIIIEQA